MFRHLITFIIVSFFLFSSITSASEFVGSAQCKSCHQQEFESWQDSHHAKAMQHVNDKTVLGNFADATFLSNGVDNKFYRKGKEFWTKIKGENGQLENYQIKYTFGYTPLQQYMVEFDDGRVQLIPFAWDSRTKQEGGQRWFNLYPEMTEKHQEFFWTNTGQNWNYMCADCHSTNVKKNFDLEKNQYKTSFSEINVGCESCHGAASEHIFWLNMSLAEQSKSNFSGFNRDLSKQVEHWVKETGKNTLMPKSIHPTQQTLVCAQCHSRHVQISDNDHVKSNEFGDRYLLSKLDGSLYYPDGQVFDEDFVYGSFLQSKMNQNGVTCSNCHNPHSGNLTMPIENVCLQCHQAENYATKQHHQHQENSEGAQCVNCHMPETTYMQVDARRDHGWHIPRPDFSLNFGTPDTCLSCHKDRDSQWSGNMIQTWYPNSAVLSSEHFAPAFAAANYVSQQNSQAVAAELSKIAQNNSFSDIVRASAMDKMALIPDTNTLIAIARGAKSEKSLVRLGAVSGAAHLPAAERWRIISPLLTDKVLAVRTEAVSILIPLWQTLSKEQKEVLQVGLDEYNKVQNFNNDRGFSHTNMGNNYTHQGKLDEAEESYNQSIRIEPNFAAAYINLADVYRMQQQNERAIKTLLQGEKSNPDNAELPYAVGLAYIRDKQMNKASQYLNKATKLSPGNANYFYVYALSLEKTNLNEAYRAMSKAFDISQNPQHLFALCDMQVRYKSFQAKKCINQLSRVAPANVVNQLKKQYENNLTQ